MGTDLAIYGISEKLYEKRMNDDQQHIDDIQIPLQWVVGDLKEAKDWKKMPFNRITNRFKFKRWNDRLVLQREIIAHENIISRPAQSLHNNSEEYIAATIPLEYKYVSKEEKKRQGLDGLCFRKIQGKLREDVEAVLKDKQFHGILADILMILESLYTDGAMNGWIVLEAIKISSLTGTPLKNVVDVLDELRDNKILVLAKAKTNRGGKTKNGKTLCTFARTPKDYDLLSMQGENAESISIFVPQKRSRIQKTAKETLKSKLAELITKDLKQEIKLDPISDDELHETTETNEGHDKLLLDALHDDKDKPLDFQALYSKIMGNTFDVLNEVTHKYIEKRIGSYEKMIEQNQDSLSKLWEQAEKYKELYNEEKTAREKQQLYINTLEKFNRGLMANTTEVMNDFIGRLMTMVEDFASMQRYERRDPKFLNKFKSDAFELINETTTKIANYRPDRYPPAALKKKF